MRPCNFRQTALRGVMLRKQRKRLICLKGPSLGYVRARSLLRQVPQLQLGTPTESPPELQAPSTAAGIPLPDKTSPPATRKEHPRAFIVDDFDKCVIRRKSKNFTRSGSSYMYPPLTCCFQCHYVNVSVLIKFKKKCFYLDYHKFSLKSCVFDVY